MSNTENWNNFLALIKEELSGQAYQTWFEAIDLLSVDDEKITIGSAANGDFAVGCQLRGVSVTATASSESTDLSVAGDNSVIIEGDTHGCGSGVINFVFNGTILPFIFAPIQCIPTSV